MVVVEVARFPRATHMLLPDLPDEGVEDVVDVPAVRGRRLDEPAAELVGERLPLLRTHAPLPALLQVHLVAHQDHRNVVGRTNLQVCHMY